MKLAHEDSFLALEGVFHQSPWWGRPIWSACLTPLVCCAVLILVGFNSVEDFSHRLPASFIFLLPGQIMVVGPLLAFPIDCHATLFGNPI